jgi:hypothetical protein
VRWLPAASVVLIESSAFAAPCPALTVPDEVPRGLEATYFTSAGYASANSAGKRAHPAVFAAGVELTGSGFRWRGFPSGYSGAHARSELRYGAYLMGGTRIYGGLVEGGAVLDVTSLYHASWGTFTLRGGAGYGAFPDERATYASATMIYGVRSVLAHFGGCRTAGRAIPEASVARLFATHRRAFREEAFEWVFGIELSPTFFLPPVTWWRLAGGPPY